MAKKPGEIDYESIAQHTFHATKEQNIYAHRAKRSPYFEQLWVERFNETVLQFPVAELKRQKTAASATESYLPIATQKNEAVKKKPKTRTNGKPLLQSEQSKSP